jgi:hypothetical protein
MTALTVTAQPENESAEKLLQKSILISNAPNQTAQRDQT